MQALTGVFELLCLGATPDSDKESEETGFSTSSETFADLSDEASREDGGELFLAPQEVERKCTDLGCCVVWLLAVGVAMTVIVLGSFKPERHDFIRLTDGRGTQCGVYTEVGKDYWYLCGANMTNDTFLPTCVEDCSMAHKIDHCSREWDLLKVDTYEAQQVGPLCWPTDVTLAAHLRFVLEARGFKSIDVFLSVYYAWPPLAVAAFCAIAFSHMWTRILRDHAHCLAWIGIYVLVMLPLVTLAYMWLRFGKVERADAIIAIVVAACFACLACRSEPTLGRATSLLHAACTCVTDVRLLEVGPAVVSMVKIASLFAAIYLIRFIPTTLHFEIRTGYLQFLHYGDHSRQIADVSVAVLYIILFAWIWNVINIFWELSSVAMTVLWVVHRRDGMDRPTILECLQVLAVMLRFHSGTIALAAVVIGFVRPIRFFFGTLTAVTRMPQNPLSWMERSCCPCIVEFYLQVLDQFSANALVDLVIHGSSLCPSMRNALPVMRSCETVANSLNGTTFIFQLICLALTWWFGFVISYISVTQIPQYSDPIHFGYVPYTMYWCLISGCIATVCSYPHVMVFDIVSDTILYLETIADIHDAEIEEQLRLQRGVAAPIYDFWSQLRSSTMACFVP